MPKRVLYVFDKATSGAGLAEVTKQQVLALSEAGCEIDLLARSAVAAPGVRNLIWPLTPANLVSWVSRRFYHRNRRAFFSWLGTRRLRRHGPYDALITWHKLAPNLIREASAMRVPVLLNCGSLPKMPPPPPIPQESPSREYLRSGAHVLSTSEFATRQFLQCGCDPRLVHPIERGFDPARFRPAAPPPPELPFRLLFCGRLTPRKGVLELLRIWRDLAPPDAELWLAGAVPREHRADILRLLIPSAKLLGFRESVNETMRQCHAQILLSSNEGQAKSLLEGAACGLVTIATPETGFPFHRAEMGFEVHAARPDQVKNAIRSVISNPALRARLAANSAHTMAQHYTWPAFRQRFITAFESVTAAPPPNLTVDPSGP